MIQDSIIDPKAKEIEKSVVLPNKLKKGFLSIFLNT